MKDLGLVKQILGMNIYYDKKSRKLWLSQENYIEKVLENINMNKAKTVCSPLVGHFKFNSTQCPISEKDMKEMSRVSLKVRPNTTKEEHSKMLRSCLDVFFRVNCYFHCLQSTARLQPQI